MRQSQRTHIARFTYVCLLGGLLLLTASLGCKETIPPEGVFPIKVIALTGDKVGIADAQVMINTKLLGKTDKFGTFVGTYSGKVDEWIAIKVVGQGPGNLMKVRSKLKMRKTQNGWVPAEVKVEAFLRPVVGGVAAAGTPPIRPIDPTMGGTPQPTPGTRGLVPAPPQPTRIAPVPRDPRDPPSTPRSYPRRQAPVAPSPTPRAVPAPPSFNGKYKISVSANVNGVRVSLRGRRRARGYIAQANNPKTLRYRDKGNPPKTIKVTFQVRKNAWKYKQSKIVKELNLQYGQADATVEATFEKKPPMKIKVKANLAGIKVYMNGSMKGTIADPNTPLELEYEGKRRTASIRLVAPNRKIRPRSARIRVRFKPDQYEYLVEKQFTAPEPRAPAIPRAQPQPRFNGGGDPPPVAVAPRVAPPVARRRIASGIYNITISANVDGVYVKSGRRRLGFIPQAGGSLTYRHKDRRVPPRALTLVFRAKNRFAYMQRSVSKRLVLEAGREDGYRVEAQFEKRRPIKILCKASVAGVKVYLNGKAKGVTVAAGQPLVLEYNGKPKRSLRVEFRSPNPRVITPRRIRKTVRIVSGTFEYTVEGTFGQKDVGDKVLNASCFRRTRGRKRVVTLLARAGTTLVLIGDCNNEQLGRTGRSGRLRVKMPVGSFQRVKAIFGAGSSVNKVIEVSSGRGPMSVRLSSGGKRCNLNRIKKKVFNKIRLEAEEIGCLKKVQKASPQYFSAQLALARYFCSRRKRSTGKRFLTGIGRNPRNRYNPYRALQMGIEYGRCRDQNKAISLLKQAERLVNRIPPVDRYNNKKALYRAMSQIYEQRYYRKKNATDLTRSLKLMQRLRDIARGNDGSTKSFAVKEVSRLKKLVASRGGGLDE